MHIYFEHLILPKLQENNLLNIHYFLNIHSLALGYSRNTKDRTWEFSAELYYKTLTGQMESLDGMITAARAEGALSAEESVELIIVELAVCNEIRGFLL